MICTKGKTLEVLESAAGYYIGTLDEGPYCRLSDCYWQHKHEAQAALDSLEFPVRYNSVEILYCSGGQCLLMDRAKEA